ncbi:tetratricopeptide repeat protein [Telmatospirillum siberiense]|uniref:Uncharacterized protein n=1 Tax=Telmatospirillum siberiense TaxID=382514 RepID=A0A2N3PMJ8_9PROT|nr:tetratricopeptide repeat protein [Telmatospirillum siberiense]PKU21620.1 hypothetical protein CWS72_25775 [Telmatospirillum siberiense]
MASHLSDHLEVGTDLVLQNRIAAARRQEAAGNILNALQILADLLSTHPGHRDILLALARLNKRIGAPQDSLLLIQLALQSHPTDRELQSELADSLEACGRTDDGLAVLERLALAAPDDPHPLLRLSYMHRRHENHEAAEEICARMLIRYPDFSMGWVSHGIGDHRAGRNVEAETCFQKALTLDPENPVAHLSRACNLLAMGRWREGFAEFEWRRKLPNAVASPVAVPVCNGHEPAGTRLLLWNDQGLGDAIQFLRYLPLVKAHGYKPILVLSKELCRLARSVSGADIVLPSDAPLPPCDAHLPLMSVPFVLGAQKEIVPADEPYVQPDRQSVARWANRLTGLPGLKVGLVWAGAARKNDFQAHTLDRRRSLDLAQLRPLLTTPGTSFVSLQMGREFSSQIAALPPDIRPFNPMDEVEDFLDTAAVIQNLDLVISVDTSVAHLAGALGKPVWILSRFDGCWRWLKDRDDSPWYPTVRLFRQNAPGQWDDVISRTAAALHESIGSGDMARK